MNEEYIPDHGNDTQPPVGAAEPGDMITPFEAAPEERPVPIAFDSPVAGDVTTPEGAVRIDEPPVEAAPVEAAPVEAAPVPVTHNCGWALNRVRKGEKVRRADWPIAHHICLVLGSPHGHVADYSDHIDKNLYEGMAVRWTATSDDLLADDWVSID